LSLASAYVGLGSNLDDPGAQVERALDELAGLPQTCLQARSALYRSPPMGPPDQPYYINAVAALSTTLEAEPLLAELLALERAHGRRRNGQRWGPRTLDLDLLVYGEARIDVPGLRVPHPGIAERSFVIYPLAEVAPGLVVPGLGAVTELCARCPSDGLERLS
jgi:2-amino-4-hydroxy-6-hydroxymethyldihydropteridine diphosphokinase